MLVILVLSAAAACTAVTASAEGVTLGNGARVYATYCALCHGATGNGGGRAAHLQQVRPADFTASRRSRQFRLNIVRAGDSALGRSSSMPAWEKILTEQEIADVVTYLQSLSSDPAQNAVTDDVGLSNSC
jgi:mono/diheme cytochrome c family protein